MATAARSTDPMARARRAERLLYRLRERYSYYYDLGKGPQVSMLIAKCKLLATPLWQARHKAQTIQRLRERGD